MVENTSWDEAWEAARNGNALFDKQREIKVDNYYEAPVAKIAKQISTGKTIGEVMATLQTPEEFEADCKHLKILHHREWTFDFTRLKQISDEQHELDSKIRIGVKRSKMEVQGIDTDEMSDDEIENYFNI
jgi:hypothetical protein